MDFLSIVLFLGLYYIRPQEWIPIVYHLQPVKIAMILAIISMALKYRERSFLKDLFRTPHDWFMLVYFLWLVGSGPDVRWTFSHVYSYLLFYLVTVQTLSNIERIQSYLNWWTFFMFAVALLALGGEYGFDPMESYDVTHGRMKGRLVLNTSIFVNPNALGHSVIPVIVMLYFLLFWKRPVFSKIAVIPMMFFPLYCIYLTLSKGAFVSGFATVIMALTYRRPKTVQLIIFLVAFTMGWTAVKLLPRMAELEDAKSEGGIQGRVAAFQFGLEAMQEQTAGIGFQRFITEFAKEHGYPKAPHSSYVQIGAELGFTGLFLYLGIFYCSLRTLITAKTTDVAEERVRRILFVLLLSFMVSSWMVGWAYRAVFFLLAGVVAAFHRQMLVRAELAQAEPIVAVPEPAVVLEIGGTETPLRRGESSSAVAVETAPVPTKTFTLGEPEFEPELANPGIRWNKIGWIDLSLVLVMLIVTVKFWQYIMRNI